MNVIALDRISNKDLFKKKYISDLKIQVFVKFTILQYVAILQYVLKNTHNPSFTDKA